MIKNILVTGAPGCGKTTLVRRVAENLEAIPVAGFYTEEIREKGERVGFALVS
ncbi:MAG: nucleoside-triphosphatase, partial [Methanomicrobiales archaeon]